MWVGRSLPLSIISIVSFFIEVNIAKGQFVFISFTSSTWNATIATKVTTASYIKILAIAAYRGSYTS